MKKDQTVFNRTDIALIYDVTPAAVTEWMLAGCPTNGKTGVHLRLDIKEVVQWRQKRLDTGDGETLNYQTERARYTKAQRTAKEIEIKLLEGSLVPVEDYILKWAQVATSIKQRLLAIPSKVAPLLGSAKNALQRKEIVEKQVMDVLNELADDAPGITNGTIGGTNVKRTKTAAKGVRKPVGRPGKKA